MKEVVDDFHVGIAFLGDDDSVSVPGYRQCRHCQTICHSDVEPFPHAWYCKFALKSAIETVKWVRNFQRLDEI